MSLQENLNALNARLQKVLKPGADQILEQHMDSLTKSGFAWSFPAQSGGLTRLR